MLFCVSYLCLSKSFSAWLFGTVSRMRVCLYEQLNATTIRWRFGLRSWYSIVLLLIPPSFVVLCVGGGFCVCVSHPLNHWDFFFSFLHFSPLLRPSPSQQSILSLNPVQDIGVWPREAPPMHWHLLIGPIQEPQMVGLVCTWRALPIPIPTLQCMLLGTWRASW
jgi:hypothetical protein